MDRTYTTDVHGFAIGLNEPAEYVASGSVNGTLLNQFSMDEHDGYLRIVTQPDLHGVNRIEANHS